MQPLVVAAAFKNSPGVLVDNDYFTIHDDIVTIFPKQFLRANCVVQVTDKGGVHCVVKVVDPEFVFNDVNCLLVYTNCLFLLVDFIVLIQGHFLGDSSELRVPLGCLVGRTTDDQRGSGLVNQNRVNFVDYCKVVTTLDHFFC